MQNSSPRVILLCIRLWRFHPYRNITQFEDHCGRLSQQSLQLGSEINYCIGRSMPFVLCCVHWLSQHPVFSLCEPLPLGLDDLRYYLPHPVFPEHYNNLRTMQHQLYGLREQRKQLFCVYEWVLSLRNNLC